MSLTSLQGPNHKCERKARPGALIEARFVAKVGFGWRKINLANAVVMARCRIHCQDHNLSSSFFLLPLEARDILWVSKSQVWR